MNPDKIRGILNSIFLLGTLVSIIVYFAVDDKKIFLYVCGATLFFKMMEFFIRFTNR
ncbi:hypothetical protein [Bacteroides sp. 224]|uniref:hypothetical protein n=1 Tax=Bacteroides sp. 224 TaxID=2302936 RepID=UPI0019402CFA|nr:hypothetical protein [Bacteroides sp. 224]